MNTLEELASKPLNGFRISKDEGAELFRHAPLGLLMHTAHMLRTKMHPGKRVGWLIDRNVNITNICVSRCRFCNFCRLPGDEDAYVTSADEYRTKIQELFDAGGEQLLLQGGLHPGLNLDYYCDLFSTLKRTEPRLKLHALGPPEIVYLAKKDNLAYKEVLERLVSAGLDSLPGAGAEILSDRVRQQVSPAKCSSGEWLEVMRVAHAIGLVTSATMVYGMTETIEERMEHLDEIRILQQERPAGAPGFLSFILWPFQGKDTRLQKIHNIASQPMSAHIRMLALSRLMLDNIPNIQASWLTLGVPLAQLCLHAGANDMGSVMMEENVVAQAGVHRKIDAAGMKHAITEAGFVPAMRNQQFVFADDTSQK